jgi:hypothetical protein
MDEKYKEGSGCGGERTPDENGWALIILSK